MAEIKVKGTDEKLRIENIYCIGRNYLEHIKEFDTPEKKLEAPKEPMVFLKPNTAAITADYISIPVLKGKKISDNLQNEVELVVVIGKDGVSIPKENAMEYVYGYAVGIDFTLRDVQAALKKEGMPWALSKGFLMSAPVSEIVKKEEVKNAENLCIRLKLNGEIKQDANTSMMIFKLPYLIHYISSIFGLKKGDMIFTGTPAGITKLNSGDKIEAEIETVGKLNVMVV